MGAIHQGLGAGGGVAFWDNSIKYFFFSSWCFSEHSKQRRKTSSLLFYLCLLLECTTRLAHVTPPANTQDRDLVVPLTMQCPSVTTAPHFWCNPSCKAFILLGIWHIKSFFTHMKLHLKDDIGMTRQCYEVIFKSMCFTCTCTPVLIPIQHIWKIPIYCKISIITIPTVMWLL